MSRPSPGTVTADQLRAAAQTLEEFVGSLKAAADGLEAQQLDAIRVINHGSLLRMLKDVPRFVASLQRAIITARQEREAFGSPEPR